MSSRMLPTPQIQAVKINIAVTVATNIALFIFLVQVMNKLYCTKIRPMIFRRKDILSLILKLNHRSPLLYEYSKNVYSGILETMGSTTTRKEWGCWLQARGWQDAEAGNDGGEHRHLVAEHDGQLGQYPILLHLQWLLPWLLLLKHQWAWANKVGIIKSPKYRGVNLK